ncbi:MAG: hypothetical protein JEZ03_00570 [Bacteroidales bacterium]|nr:hypothetical protein [Bacteroidales bacterium]
MIRYIGLFILILSLSGCRSSYFSEKVPEDLGYTKWLLTTCELPLDGETYGITSNDTLNKTDRIVIEFQNHGKLIITINNRNTFKGHYKLRKNKFLEIDPKINSPRLSKNNYQKFLNDQNFSFIKNISNSKYYLIEDNKLILKYYYHPVNEFGTIHFSPINLISDSI